MRPFFPSLALMVLLAGCSSRTYSGDERFALSGKITCDGEIIDAGTISFIPQDKDQRLARNHRFKRGHCADRHGKTMQRPRTWQGVIAMESRRRRQGHGFFVHHDTPTTHDDDA